MRKQRSLYAAAAAVTVLAIVGVGAVAWSASADRAVRLADVPPIVVEPRIPTPSSTQESVPSLEPQPSVAPAPPPPPPPAPPPAPAPPLEDDDESGGDDDESGGDDDEGGDDEDGD